MGMRLVWEVSRRFSKEHFFFKKKRIDKKPKEEEQLEEPRVIAHAKGSICTKPA